MAEQQTNISDVGIVETETLDIPLPEEGFRLQKGDVLSDLTVAYETYGSLTPERDNVVYICHALTGNAHVAGRFSQVGAKPGWWDNMVGPGKGIDTDYYYVICSNVLGGCCGTTGPASTNPDTGKPYGSSFPEITAADMIRVQKLLLEHMDIDRLAAVIGGSFGGMQALMWSIMYPDMVERCVCIAAGAALSAQALAFDVVAREAITSDPNWAGGDYYDQPEHPNWGLAHARKIGHITYLSPEIMQEKFGRETVDHEALEDHCFQVESYLTHQGRKLVERFDANSYLRITQAMDSFDLRKEFGSLEKAFETVKSKFLIIGISSDWLFPPRQSLELAAALIQSDKQVSCCTLEAPYGHDAFLVDVDHLTETIRAFLPWVGPDKPTKKEKKEPHEKTRFNIIIDSVRRDARVLDLGCGKGELLNLLLEEKAAAGFGVDIDLDNVIQTIDRGHDVFQGDLDRGLSIIPDQSYDYAILSSTLQVVKRPGTVLREMVRVAHQGIITFPNFGNWRNRAQILFGGHMPKSEALPYEWYETPNIHVATRNDFFQLCGREGIEVIDMVCIPGKCPIDRLLVSLKRCNLGAEWVLAKITGAEPGSITTPAANCRPLPKYPD